MLLLLEVYWRNNPDMRLGQIIECAKPSAKTDIDTFYVKDEDLENGINVLIEKQEKFTPTKYE